MKQYFIDKKSSELLLFFAGWACDEYEFSGVETSRDVLILYDYEDLALDFDFSGYKNIDLIGFSAGVFVSSVVAPRLDIKIKRKIAMNGNPYLFDKRWGLTSEIIEVFRSITDENAEDFVREYLIKTDEERQNFRSSKRSIESSNRELDSLFEIYQKEKENIKNIFDTVILGDCDPIFKLDIQREFWQKRENNCENTKLIIVKNARHNLFSRIKRYEEILSFGV